MTSLTVHLTYFLLICLATAFVTVTTRIRDPRAITRETTRLFLQVSIGILLFCGLVFVVEWIWVRPLL